MEIKKVYVKTRTEFGKQCIFDTCGPNMDQEILPNLTDANNYLLRSHCYVGVQHSKQLALHEAQTMRTEFKNTGMYHFEGGWPKEINPKDEETTMRFRRRVEKDDNWAPKLRKLYQVMEKSVLQNGAVNIYQHYFDDMIPSTLVQSLGLRTVNVYADQEVPPRPVSNISWSPDNGSRIAVSHCHLKFGRVPDYSKRVYIWQVDNPNEPHMTLEPFCPCVVCDFNPRDPSVLASGLMTGQVCNWDIRTGTTPVQSSHLQFSHRNYANAVKWLPTKSNTEFFSTSSDGRAMWWDTRSIRKPTEILMCDLENPNEPDMDRAIGVSCVNYGPMVGTKFMFGMDNGVILTGSRKSKTNAEKLAVRFNAHYGPVVSVDRNEFNPTLFMTVGDWTARVWAEDTREGNLVSTLFLLEYPTGGCWNKSRYSVFYVITASGQLLAWDLLQSLRQPICRLKLCKERLTTISPFDDGMLLAIGNSSGKVFLVESMEFLQSFDKKDRSALSEYLERCSKLTKAVDVRLKEMKLVLKVIEEEKAETAKKTKDKMKTKKKTVEDSKKKSNDSSGAKTDSKKNEPKEKEKKKPREDALDLLQAEQRYNEIIEKELERYTEESNLDLIPVRQQPTSAKKSEKKRKTSERSSQEDVESKSESKGIRHKKNIADAGGKRRPPLLKIKRERSVVTTATVSSSKRSLGNRSLLLSKSNLSTKKAERRKKRKKISFELPVPCKSKVCRPKVCCWRTDSKRKKRREAKPGKELSTVSLAKYMDGSSARLSRLSRLRSSRRSILREMLEPPSELTLEVENARKEIAVAWSGGRLRKRHFVKRLTESRAKLESEKLETDTYKDVEDEEPESGQEEFESQSEEEEQRIEDEYEKTKEKPEITVDPCSPLKMKTTAEDFSTILGVPVRHVMEGKIDAQDYLKELEAARKRIYPRISEFHLIE